MIKKFIFINSFLIIFVVFFSVFLSFIPLTSRGIGNTTTELNLIWSDELREIPVIPRDEIVEINITALVEIKTGLTFGEGLLEGYTGSPLIFYFTLEDHPSWCYANLKLDTIVKKVSKGLIEVSTSLYLMITENAPAYGEGYVKINVRVRDMGLIKGVNKSFTLSFKPAYFPIIKINLPNANAARTNPTNMVMFPIEIENLGNSRTKVLLEVENIPEGWSATITNSIIVGEAKGSKSIVYLSVVPPSSFGYHYEDALLNVRLVPTLAEDQNQSGAPIYANFIVQSRGFSSSGLEFYIPIAFIILIIIALFSINIIKKNKKQ